MPFRERDLALESPFLDEVPWTPPEVSQEREETGVIAGDNRVRITATTGVPWRWICRIAILDNRGRFHSGGTGVLVSDRHVLTSAHVVYPEYVDPYNYSITVTPALNEADEPFGQHSVQAKPRIPKDYDPNRDESLDWDYALLTLKERAGEKTFRALRDQPLCYWGHPQCGAGTVFIVPDARALNGKSALTAGYPRGKGGKQLWCATGLLHSATAQRRTMSITADATKGQSGSPVWIKEGKQYCLVGVMAGAGNQSNRVVRVTRELIDQVRTWIQADGDTPVMRETAPAIDPEVVLESEGAMFERDDPAASVGFHGGQALPIVTGPEKPGEEFHDPAASGNPLLDTSGAHRRKKLSANFTVAELARAGSTTFNKARIDPYLVMCLQELHDFLGKPVEVVEGYYSYKYLAAIAKKQGLASVPKSPHLSGRGAKIRVAGLSMLELAKAAMITSSEDTTVGAGDGTVTMYVRQNPAQPFSYLTNGEKRERVLKTLREFYELYYKLPPDLFAPLRKPTLDGGIQYVHWAVHDRQVRDEHTLTEIVFYRSGYVRELREKAGLKGRYNPAAPRDRTLWEQVRTVCVLPVLKELVAPAQQRGGVPTTPKGQRVSSPAKPDNVGFDITGRYEKTYTSGSVLGKVLNVNQAGRRIELVMSEVLGPTATTYDRKLYRLYGDLVDSKTFKLFSRRNPNLIFTLVRNGTAVEFHFEQNGKKLKETFTPVSYTPFLTERALKAFGTDEVLITMQEWYPLLQSQLAHIKNFFGDENRINQYLKSFYTAKGDFLNKWDEQAQGEAAKKFNDDMTAWVKNPRLGFHRNDLMLAKFYIRQHLASHFWRPKTNYPYLSQLDWIYRMIAILHELDRTSPARSMSMGNFDEIVRFTGADATRSIDGHVHSYKATLRLTGGAFLLGGFRGKITIEKTDDRKWNLPNVTFSATFLAFGISWTVKRGGKNSGLGPVSKRTLVGYGNSFIEWIPHDFPGTANLFIGELAGSAGVKGTLEGWFIHIFGHLGLPMLPILDENAKLGVGGAPSIKGTLLGAKGWIHDKTLPTTGFPSIQEKTDYAANYGLTTKAHFGFDSAVLTDEARQAVRAMCANELLALITPESSLKVVGHTDAPDTDLRNVELSRLRADNTVTVIKDVMGSRLAASLQAEYKGEAEAKAANEKERNMDRRRVDIELNGQIVLRLKAQ